MPENLDPLYSYDLLGFLRQIYRLFFGGPNNATDWASHTHNLIVTFFKDLPFYLINIYAKYTVFAFLISLVLIILVIVYIMREKEIRTKIMDKVLPAKGEIKTDILESVMENPKWKLVEEHINSDDANKWKLAILEADIILSELLDSLNLKGESVGEKLKMVEASDFDHIEQAWEAHKIRNAIAHQGSDFLLTKREAQRVLSLYESVFKEFEII